MRIWIVENGVVIFCQNLKFIDKDIKEIKAEIIKKIESQKKA